MNEIQGGGVGKNVLLIYTCFIVVQLSEIRFQDLGGAKILGPQADGRSCAPRRGLGQKSIKFRVFRSAK